MLRGLALTHLKRKEEAEKVGLRFGSYRRGLTKSAISSHTVYIPKFYSEIKNWEKLGRFYESRVQQTYNE
jgi:hypothetical protein